MKASIPLTVLSCMAISAAPPSGSPGTPIPELFIGTTPCGAVTRPLHGIPARSACELIKWQLSLDRDPSTLAPTTYSLESVYGLPEQGTEGLVGGGTRIKVGGLWTIARAGSEAPAVVYQLNPDTPDRALSLLRLDHNVLHLLGATGAS